jgi:hypothetical protein
VTRTERRMRKALAFWNSRLDKISRSIVHSRDRIGARFKWNQLVWQEIRMFVLLGSQVGDEDLRWLCQRRRFTRSQRQFLEQALEHVGLR